MTAIQMMFKANKYMQHATLWDTQQKQCKTYLENMKAHSQVKGLLDRKYKLWINCIRCKYNWLTEVREVFRVTTNDKDLEETVW
jgi:hypothetical protein